MYSNECPDPVKVLQNLSSHIGSLSINQRRCSEVHTEANHFFGLNDVYWAPIFLHMFSHLKFDTLCIKNCFYTNYLSDESARILREELPMLGNKVLYRVTGEFYKPNYTMNERSVTATYFDDSYSTRVKR
ncbi:hypothetical protein PENTCL1PPCAC_12562 [Pristionchus entomophagus]|uniref:Uncharacterized protein n=1 Tax=Pristionchus entomophagus TaxID=358040 RepID=A0AAV5T481_9BILA|nr:hypothetical protein PENTCL1PPCAC_12562 [Pristionchus entomophagus]